MLMIVYADIYILINLVCNFISLLMCAAITSSVVRCFRFLLSSFLMALYSFFILFFKIYPFFGIPMDCIVLIAGMRVAFGKNNIAFLLKASCVFFVSCVVSGGVAGMISGVSRERGIIILLIAPVIYLLWYASVKNMKHSRKLVSVVIDGKALSGFSDSGNILYDNQKGLHVIVARSDKLGVEENTVAGMIKTATVCGTGYMPYYYPDTVEIEHRKVRAAVALADTTDMGYDCIVPEELIW